MTIWNSIFGIPDTEEEKKKEAEYFSKKHAYYKSIESRPSGVCRISNALLSALMPKGTFKGIHVENIRCYDFENKGLSDTPCLLPPSYKLLLIAFATFAWERVKNNPEETSEVYPDPFGLKERCSKTGEPSIGIRKDISLGINAEDYLYLLYGLPLKDIQKYWADSFEEEISIADLLKSVMGFEHELRSYEFEFHFDRLRIRKSLITTGFSFCEEKGSESLHLTFDFGAEEFFYGLDGTNWGYTEIPTKFLTTLGSNYLSEVFVNLALYLFIKMGRNRRAGKLYKSTSFSFSELIDSILDKKGFRYFTEDEVKKYYLDVNKIKSELREAVKNLKAIGLIKDYKISFSYKGIVLYFNYDY